jgi:hypothetical protein
MRRLEELNPERRPEQLRRLSVEHRPLVEAYLNRNRERRMDFLRSLLDEAEGRPSRRSRPLNSLTSRTAVATPRARETSPNLPLSDPCPRLV